MKRSLVTDRLYNLGDFKNIRFSDEFNDIPEEFMLDSEFVSGIRSLQVLGVEILYREYLKLQHDELVGKDLEGALERLYELRDEMYESIVSILDKDKDKENTKKEK